jgi:hypothetical protein
MKNKISYPRYYIKFYLDGKVVNSLSTKKMKRIIFRIRLSETKFKWNRCFLKFQYDKKFHNAGSYTNLKDLERAYRCFVEIVEEFV